MVDETRPQGPPPRPRTPYSRQQIISQAIMAAVILVSGIGIGTGGTILMLKDRINWVPRPFPGPRPDPNFIKRWQAEYGLTDDQVQRADEAFRNSWTSTRTLFEKMEQERQVVQAKFTADMKTILTAEQFQKWEEELKRRAEHFRQWRPGGPGGRPGGPGGPGGRPGGRDGERRDHGPFRGEKGFRPPPDFEPPPGEKGLPPSPNQPGGPPPGPKPE